mmetsp:Transcript_43524/g.138855  ORF Transcript_43524/g.138855 Transcript_43524/m.138855 type:complete len:262 (+) Transcript_43524:613-1398(+)
MAQPVDPGRGAHGDVPLHLPQGPRRREGGLGAPPAEARAPVPIDVSCHPPPAAGQQPLHGEEAPAVHVAAGARRVEHRPRHPARAEGGARGHVLCHVSKGAPGGGLVEQDGREEAQLPGEEVGGRITCGVGRPGRHGARHPREGLDVGAEGVRAEDGGRPLVALRLVLLGRRHVGRVGVAEPRHHHRRRAPPAAGRPRGEHRPPEAAPRHGGELPRRAGDEEVPHPQELHRHRIWLPWVREAHLPGVEEDRLGGVAGDLFR